MIGIISRPKALVKLIAAFTCLALSSCFLVPGDFQSKMAISKSGAFSFDYVGQIVLPPLQEADGANANDHASDDEFSAKCFEDESFEERECTADEMNEQLAANEAAMSANAERGASRKEAMSAILGGLDPDKPESIDQFVSRLSRQKGWEKVEYAGNGVFNITYRITGRLDHGFAFPVIEDLPNMPVFLNASLRENGSVRISAPGFAPVTSSAGAGGLGMLGMLTAMAPGNDSAESVDGLPRPSGKFSLRTDGDILANNTDEGPVTEGGWKVLNWTIGDLTKGGPEALIQR